MGDKLIERDFNTKSFLNYHDYENDDVFIEKIINLHSNNDEYENMIKEPWFNNNEIPQSVTPEEVLKFIKGVLN